MSKQLDTLYKRGKNGKVLSYETSIKSTDFGYDIIKRAGQLDGKKTEHRTLIIEGKQKRTVEQQAIFMAESDWKKKKDEGYKTLSDLEIKETEDVYFVGNTDILTFPKSNLIKVLHRQLPEDRTDANGVLKPMKCTALQDTKTGSILPKVLKKINYPALYQPKLDGVRCFLHHTNNKWSATSSSGMSYNVSAADILAELEDKYHPDKDIILDGELYIHGIPLNKLNGWASKKSRIPQHEKLEFHLFDVAVKDKQYPRMADRDGYFYDMEDVGIQRVKLVHTGTIHREEDIQEMHDYFVAQGYEGLIIRNLDGIYEYGHRSSKIFKYKNFQEAEFEIVGAELGKRGTEDMIFNMITKTGKTFSAKPIGGREIKEQYWYRLQDLIGEKATVRYLNLSEYGIPVGNPVLKEIRNYE